MDRGVWKAEVYSIANSQIKMKRLKKKKNEPLSIHTGEGNGNSRQYSCLENPMDRVAWWAAIYGVAQSRTRLKRLRGSSSTHTRIPVLYNLFQENGS